MRSTNRYLRTLCLLSMFCVTSLGAFAQTVSVSGTVRGSDGEPILGALVNVEGAQTSVITDVAGNYSIQVPSSGRLVYSFLGYIAQTVDVGGRTRIDITLESDTQRIDEVIVIGYGTQRREAVTGSVSSIGAEEIRQVQSGNVTQALQGRIAGVNMISTNTGPGTNMKIEIRGNRSLVTSKYSTANDPLIVMDGIPFPGNLGDINPGDITNIDILKDASATAIYGSRGANGVILITTSRGTQSQKPTITYNTYLGTNTLFSRYPMMSGSEFAEFKKIAFANGSSYAGFTASEDESGNTNTDWQKLVLRNGFVQNHNITISAPTSGGAYSFGVSHFGEKGLQPTQDFQRVGLRGSFDQRVGKRIRVGITTHNTFSNRNGEGMNIMNDLLQVNPTISPYDAQGNIINDRFALNGSDSNWNPLLIRENDDERIDRTRAFSSYNTLFGEVDIWGGIKYRINVGANYRQANRGTFRTGVPGYWSGVAPGSSGRSSASVDNTHNFNWSIENMLTFDRVFGKHSVNAVALFSAEQTLDYRSNMSASDLTIDQLQYYNLGYYTDAISISPGNQSYSLRGLLSYMGRVMYAYDNKYMLSLTLRSDGSSVLAPGHQWHTYPAVSVGWNIARENFMSNVDWIDMLKLRVGYGQTSNQSIEPYRTYGMTSSNWYTDGSGAFQGYLQNTVSNPLLSWEFSKTINLGLDFSLWGGRLNGTAEYYSVNTEDLLLSQRSPATSGNPGDYMNNVAKTQNRGFELSLDGTIIDNNNGWTWTAGLNFYTNRNKIVHLASGTDRDEGNMWFVGESINAIYTYKKTGIYQVGEEDIARAAYGGSTSSIGSPGNIKVAYNPAGDAVTFDANGVPSRAINGSDRMIIGSTDAKFMGGFNTMVGWRNLDLTVVGTFRNGGLLVSTLHSPNSYLNMMSGRRANIKVDYWTPDNPTNKYPKPGVGADVGGGNADNPALGQTLQYFDASYLKIRTITLGYNFRGAWMNRLGVEQLRIYASIQNPFVLFSPYTKETGLDPETNSYANENMASTSNSLPNRYATVGWNTPSTRNYLFGLNLTF